MESPPAGILPPPTLPVPIPRERLGIGSPHEPRTALRFPVPGGWAGTGLTAWSAPTASDRGQPRRHAQHPATRVIASARRRARRSPTAMERSAYPLGIAPRAASGRACAGRGVRRDRDGQVGAPGATASGVDNRDAPEARPPGARRCLGIGGSDCPYNGAVVGVSMKQVAVALVSLSLVGAVGASPVMAPRQVIPAAASAPGADGSFWSTELVVFNPSAHAATVTVTLLPTLPEGAVGTPVSVTLDIAVGPRQTATVPDLLGTLFPGHPTGAVVVTGRTDSGDRVDLVVDVPHLDPGGLRPGQPRPGHPGRGLGRGRGPDRDRADRARPRDVGCLPHQPRPRQPLPDPGRALHRGGARRHRRQPGSAVLHPRTASPLATQQHPRRARAGGRGVLGRRAARPVGTISRRAEPAPPARPTSSPTAPASTAAATTRPTSSPSRR